MLNYLKTVVAFAGFLAIVFFYSWQEIHISQQPPKSQDENQRAAHGQYQTGPFTPFRLIFTGNLKQITGYCNSHPEKEKNNWPQTYYCDLKITDVYIAFFSGLLVFVTGGLIWVGVQQYRDTRILERAFISVNLGGLTTDTFDHVIGRVIFENTGRLPAMRFRWRIKICPHTGGDFIAPKISSEDLEANAVVPVGAKWTMGSGACTPRPEHAWEYVYVWSRVEYTDGFGRSRFTNFCHRYSWAVRKRTIAMWADQPGSSVIDQVSASDGRFHKNGNESD